MARQQLATRAARRRSVLARLPSSQPRCSRKGSGRLLLSSTSQASSATKPCTAVCSAQAQLAAGRAPLMITPRRAAAVGSAHRCTELEAHLSCFEVHRGRVFDLLQPAPADPAGEAAPPAESEMNQSEPTTKKFQSQKPGSTPTNQSHRS